MSELTPLVQIKGLREGLLVSLSDAPWEQQRAALLSQIDERHSFFRGARLAVDVGSQVLHVNDLVELRDRLSERSVALWAVMSESPTTEKTAQLLGLATRISKPRPEENRRFSVEDLGEQTALFLDKTLRSGSRVEFAGHVVVLGDLNPGAEVLAEGSVLVWGRLRGAVQAGAKGDGTAVVCALELSPMQLRIGEAAANISERKSEGGPEVAFLQDGQVLIEPWKSG